MPPPTNPAVEQDVLTAPSVLECPICNEQYSTDYRTMPRVLSCGHTYCTRCLMQLVSIHSGKRYGVKCAFCNQLHELPRPDPTLIPLNHAVIEIIKISDSKKVKDVGPQCEYRGTQCVGNASWVCFDCNPTTNTMFCEVCIKTEHERGFEPVARHRRVLMAHVNNPHTAFCMWHPKNKATLYSVKLQKFACAECNSRPDFAEQKALFEPIGDTVRQLRTQAKRMVKYSQDILAKLNVSLGNLSANNKELGPAVQQTQTLIQEKFAEIVTIIQEREKTLMKHVQTEYSERKQGVEDQLHRIKVAFTEISEAQGSLNSALGRHDVDFLLYYSPAYQAMEKVLREEDRSLQRTVSYKDIPFFIPQSIMADLRKVGAVGGGVVPYDIEVESSNEHCNLMQLKWQIPHYSSEVQCYEIEYESLPNTSETGLKGSRVQSGTYYNVDPQSTIVPGNVLATYVQNLCPGYKYRFWIRSQNSAGWGMWSKSVVALCDGFPITVKSTRRIHKIRIPSDGHYNITAKGAKGADGKVHYGGRGAIISGTFALKAGDVLTVLVGTMSTKSVCNTGGGGGTFVALNETSQENLLIVAGGGGGTRGLEECDEDGCDANLETDGTDGQGAEHGKGGVNGGPGEDANSDEFAGPCWGYGGAGFMQNSSAARSFCEGGAGGQYGGFGGGGAVGLYGGGGGGGYSGGGGGRGGGGGGSYVRGDACNVRKVVGNESHGELEISAVPPPLQNEVWSGETHTHTNAALVSIASGGGGGGGGVDLINRSASDLQLPMLQSVPAVPVPSQWQAPISSHVQMQPPVQANTASNAQVPTDALRQALASQISKASSASVTSSAASALQSLSDYPQFPESTAEAMYPVATGDISREVPQPIVEEAVDLLDFTSPLDTANSMLQQFQPSGNGQAGLITAPFLPPQSQPTHQGTGSNASSDMSPPQTIAIHLNSNASTGTT